jgi:rhomboid family GlyGly-CTERM serine protease
VKGRLPIVTLLLAATALALAAIPSAAEWLVFERMRIAAGELWRVWTGHWVHFSASHLAWDVLVFVACGAFIESHGRKHFVGVVLMSATVISVALLAFEPNLHRYGGLSGIDTALMTHAGLLLLRDERSREFGAIVTGAVLLKLVADTCGLGGQIVSLPANVRTVPLSHLIGAWCGVAAMVFEVFGKTRRDAPQPLS